MNIRNEDVVGLIAEIPEGHRHLRTKIVLVDGSELIFQEATIANLVRAYITLKTDPVKRIMTMRGERLDRRKEGYAEWQLLETRTS